MRPLGVEAPIEQSMWEHQQQKLDEARTLVTELRTRRATLGVSEKISCSFRPQGDEHPCEVTFEMSFFDSWEALIALRVTRCDLGLRTFLGLLAEPDLIEFDKIPGLPVLEGVDSPHKFAPNDRMYRVNVSPWGPVPGLSDLNNAYLFDALDEDGSIIIYAQSPPEGATHHRDWALPPPGKNRKRNVITGLATIATPTPGWREGERQASTRDVPPAKQCRSPGCAFPARIATGGYCCERCRARPREHGAHCTAWLARLGETDMETCCRVKLPVPKWLLPPPLIRWLIPKLVTKVFWPKLVSVSSDFEGSPFGSRYRDDDTGFYRACAARVPLEWPVDAGTTTPNGAASGRSGSARCADCASDALDVAASRAAAQEGDDDLQVSSRRSSGGFDELAPDCRGAANSRRSSDELDDLVADCLGGATSTEQVTCI